MEFISTAVKKVEAQEMISRLRSKEDLYRYITQHGKHVTYTQSYSIVGLFLSTMEGTKISFIKAILCDGLKAFKNNEIKLIGNYPEISVTNLYDDAMKDKKSWKFIFLTRNNSLINYQRETISLVFFVQQKRSISEKSLKKLKGNATIFLMKIKRRKALQQQVGPGLLSLKSIHTSLVSFDIQL